MACIFVCNYDISGQSLYGPGQKNIFDTLLDTMEPWSGWYDDVVFSINSSIYTWGDTRERPESNITQSSFLQTPAPERVETMVNVSFYDNLSTQSSFAPFLKSCIRQLFWEGCADSRDLA